MSRLLCLYTSLGLVPTSHHTSQGVMMLPVIGFSGISRCTRRAHTSFYPVENAQLSLQSIMGKFELVSGSVIGRRTISRRSTDETAAIGSNPGPATISNYSSSQRLETPTTCDIQLGSLRISRVLSALIRTFCLLFGRLRSLQNFSLSECLYRSSIKR
jgi:hypothetical protein